MRLEWPSLDPGKSYGPSKHHAHTDRSRGCPSSKCICTYLSRNPIVCIFPFPCASACCACARKTSPRLLSVAAYERCVSPTVCLYL
jgi:hypothetical protein